jgi:glycosyltransferase involved in cell wall biosynthesis
MAMTILMLISSREWFAGSEQLVLTLTRGLTRRGYRVIVVCRHGGTLVERYRAEDVEVHPRPLAWRSIPALARLIRREGVDLIHTHLTTAARIGGLLGRLTRRPVVAHAHVVSRSRAYARAARRGRLIAVSHHVARRYEALGIPPAQMRVVHNSTLVAEDPDAGLSVEQARAAVAAELGIEPAGRWIAAPMRVCPDKGVDLLLDAAARLRDEWPQVRLLIPGRIEQTPRSLLPTHGNGATGERLHDAGVHLLGPRADIARLIRAADVVAVPSQYPDPFNLVTLEAMTLGVPVVAADVGGIPEQLTERDSGRLVRPGDAGAFADALAEILAAPGPARLNAERASGLIRTRFAIGRFVDGIEAVYADVLPRAGESRRD